MPMICCRRLIGPLAVAVACLHAAGVRAAVRLHPLFGEGAVLQQGGPVPVWGTADDGEVVVVEFQGQRGSATARAGKWLVRLENLRAGGPFELTVTGANVLRVRNVLVGEVWLCGGQSNMAWPLERAEGGTDAAAAAREPRIRFFQVARVISRTPVAEPKGSWRECMPESAASFSALGYYFGRDLHQALGVPVGLIQAAWGGTPAEAWTSREALEALPEFRDVGAIWDQRRREYEQETRACADALPAYLKTLARALVTRKPLPRCPALPVDPMRRPQGPALLFNGMVAPLVPYAVRGVIWYQGEADVDRAALYRRLFPALVRDWRNRWGGGDFPFLFVQLAPWHAPAQGPQESRLAELREAQFLTAKTVPNTAMAVITDLGDANDLHPRRKAPVGGRLALAALALAYGHAIEYSGPLYEAVRFEGDHAVLTFSHVGSGLVARGDRLRGFTVAGEDRQFENAQAEIRGNRVEVWSPHVVRPVAVRYGWADHPTGNLWNRDGLPASPFRTDDWPRAKAQPAAPPPVRVPPKRLHS